ncbi:MAG: GNAT family N-acetyltransferase [Planctomycetaceae bacterium]|nr:GNAT family N-acetyltransferase [Planctomycetaceae bacterium]
MPNVEIKAVTTRRDKKRFLELPWKIYRDDPHWIPPLRMNQKELVGFKHHPFYDNNERQAFLAMRDGEPVGRILGLINREHNRRYKENRGFFGFFESIDDTEVSRGLFDAVKQWLKQYDIQDMRGPVNPSLNYECGLLVDGFDSSPFFMMTYNHPYYESLFTNYGFEKSQDLCAFWGHVDMLETLDEKLEVIAQAAAERFNVTMRRLNPKNFKKDVHAFLDIYNQSLVNTWGFTPLSDAEMKHLSQGLRQLIAPELTTIAEVDGRPVAAAFGLLDYNPRVRQIDGKLFPFGFMRLLGNRKAIKNARILSTNVIPEYQRWGLGVTVLSRLRQDVLDWGLEEVEFSWVLETNHLSYKTLQRGGAKLYKTYRIFDLDQ